MSNLTSIERMKLEKMFDMGSGYVLDFSNRTIKEFILKNVGIDISATRYDYESGSKANRLRAFWDKEDNLTVGKLILHLLEYWKVRKELNNQVITSEEKVLYDEGLKIAERLVQNKPKEAQLEKEIEARKKKEQEAKREFQLNLLLQMFEELAKSTEPQKRGFLLQDLLNRLFLIHEITVNKSFQRNDGGEQIDGAFSYQGWYYLVECKWTKKLADIRELDSLFGKVNRSGKQTMGIFLSIEGWSENVPPLLKQNPEKCIILMDGYDLRCVLCEAIELEKLLQEKIAKLNLESEPFYSAVNLLRTKKS
jgi:hypothetical protein